MNKKGFTLIELLIVIAIIGILATVVMSSLNTARTKGTDAAIKSNLTNLRSQASIWYDDNGSLYATSGNEFASSTCPTALSTGNLLEDTKFYTGVSEAYAKAGGEAFSRCVVTESAWAVAVQLKTSDGDTAPGFDSWCVDSIGSSRAYAYAGGETIADAIDVADACK